MKIINECDTRFSSLEDILSYNVEDLFPWDNKLYMCVPQCLIINPVRISDSNWIEDYPNIEFRCLTLRGPYVNDYLFDSTGLSFQELYDLLYLHINDTDLRPTCKYCGEYTPFNGFTYGYRDFCDINCKNRWLLDQEYIKDIHRRLFSEMNIKNNSDPNFQAHSHFMYFVNNFDPNIRGFLYTAEFYDRPKEYKFGISSKTPDSKCSSMGLDDLNIEFESNILRLAWIEYQLAMVFLKEWFKKDEKSLFDRLLKFYINKSKDLEILSSTTISEESRIKLSEIIDPQI